MFIYLLITLVAAQQLDFGVYNPKFNTNAACGNFTDCFNCTFSWQCNWNLEEKKCQPDPKANYPL